jgi:hypothetical protein
LLRGVFITEFKARFERQGYYASARGRIPISELRLTLQPVNPASGGQGVRAETR